MMWNINQEMGRFHALVVVPHILEKLCLCAHNQEISLSPVTFEEVRLSFTLVDFQTDVKRMVAFLFLLESLAKQSEIDYVIYFSRTSKNVRIVFYLRDKRLKLFLNVYIIYLYKQYKRLFVAYGTYHLMDEAKQMQLRDIELKWNKFLLYFNLFYPIDYNFIRTEFLKNEVWVTFRFITNYRNPHATRLLLSHYGIDFFC